MTQSSFLPNAVCQLAEHPEDRTTGLKSPPGPWALGPFPPFILFFLVLYLEPCMIQLLNCFFHSIIWNITDTCRKYPDEFQPWVQWCWHWKRQKLLTWIWSLSSDSTPWTLPLSHPSPCPPPQAIGYVLPKRCICFYISVTMLDLGSLGLNTQAWWNSMQTVHFNVGGMLVVPESMWACVHTHTHTWRHCKLYCGLHKGAFLHTPVMCLVTKFAKFYMQPILLKCESCYVNLYVRCIKHHNFSA